MASANPIEMYHSTGLPKPGEATDFNGYDTGYADIVIPIQSTVTINYKFHDKLHSRDPTPIEIPLELFEGPALHCHELFWKDLHQEFPDMEVHERQLEFWTPTYALEMGDTIGNEWKDSVVLEHDFKKILRPLPLSSQLQWKDKNLLQLVVSIKGGWIAKRPVEVEFSGADVMKAASLFIFISLVVYVVGSLCAKYLKN